MKKLSSKKWNEIGFFEYVKPEHYRGMTILFNKAIKYIPIEDNLLNVAILPVLMRIYLGVNRTNLNVKEIISELNIHLEKHKTTITELNIIGVDGEAEVISHFTDQYIKYITEKIK